MFNKRVIIIFLLITVAIAALNSVSASDVANSTLGDAQLGNELIENNAILTSSSEGTFTELQNRIDSAGKGSTIYLTKDYYYNDDFKSYNGITITKSITIDGKGHAIDGDEQSPLLLTYKAKNVVLRNIVFRNGYNENMGIVSTVDSNNIKFENCKFIYNTAGAGTVLLDNTNYCSFTSCNIDGNEVYNEGGAVYLSNSKYTSFVKCTFNENTAGYTGGAIYIKNNYETSFTTCKFNENEAEDAGAIYLANTDHTTFTNCILNENTAEYTGGAVYMENNRNTMFTSCQFNENMAEDAGAVFLAYSDYTTFLNCNFELNEIYYVGGAIYQTNCNNSYFKSTKFNENYAYEYGGGVYLKDSGESYFESCSFNENNAGGGMGGGISANNADIYLDLCIFYSNFACKGSCLSTSESNVYSTDSTFAYCEAENVGGSIYSFKSNLNLLNNTFNCSIAEQAGGTLYSQYSMVFLENSTFIESATYGFGGGLTFNNDYVEIKNCNFKKCASLSDGGGAISSMNSRLNISSSKFSDCISYFGGAICSLNTDLLIEDNYFYNNTAEYYGGSIYSVYGSVSIENSDFIKSSAEFSGGAIYLRSPHTINSISNNRFLYSSSQQGPRIYVDEYYGEIPDCTNIFEDVYFVVGFFNGSNKNDGEYGSYSNIITYVLSNADEYQNDMSYYNSLKDTFISDMGIDNYKSADSVNATIFSEDYPNESIIFSNYDNFKSQKIVYDMPHLASDLNLRTVNLAVYDPNCDELITFDVVSIMAEKNDEADANESQFTFMYYSYNLTESNGWWILPIFENATDFEGYSDNGGRTVWIQTLDEKKFPVNSIHGEFYFNYEDRKLCSNFGNIYEFKSSSSAVPLLNYTSSIDYLPSYYDSRDYGYITPAKDQGVGGNCWAFSGMATLEACLKKITGQTYDFSEDNAKNLMAVSSVYGLNIDPNAGGYDTMFMGYLASWLGPIPEELDEYNPLSAISIDYTSIFHIQDISFLPARQNSSDNDAYKSAIINYGAISVILDWTTNEISKGMHSVCIIGWDDNYNDIDSLGNYAKGAWIFKNSWGKYWGDDGFGYLSYEEKLSEEIAPHMHAYTFVFNEGDIGYQDLYQYDFAGLTEFLCTDTDYVYYKNRFIAKDEELISGFSTYFERPTNFTYTITLNGVENYTSENQYSPAGYHTIHLDKYLYLYKGDEFEVIIKLTNEGGNSIPICQADDLYKLSYPNNVSFFSYNGRDWIDLYSLNSQYNFAYGGAKTNTSQVACIKAFSTKCWQDFTPIAVSMQIDDGAKLSTAFSTYQINVVPFTNIPINKTIYIKISISGWNEYDSYEHFMEITLNNVTRYAKIENGKANVKVTFYKEGNYSLSAKLKSNYYTSNLVKFNFTVSGAVDDSTCGTFTQLEDIINTAEEESVIYLDKDYSYDIQFDKNESIIIGKSLTIDGRGHTLNGMSQVGIFTIDEECEVYLKNIKFVNGNESSAIYSEGNLVVLNCEFINNTADFGGAILSFENLTLSNCIFMNNSANTTGGAVYSEGYCSITRCEFINNTADYGGGIVSHGKLYVDACVFKKNYAIMGSAINSNAPCDITNSIFEMNFGAMQGVMYSKGPCSIKNSIFNSNHAEDEGVLLSYDELNISNCEFKNNSAEMHGALSTCDNTIIEHCLFESNRANFSGAIDSIGNIVVNNCIFRNNSVLEGGAFYIYNPCTIMNCLFDCNSAGRYGGAIYIDDWDVEYPASSNYRFISCEFKNNFANITGGAIYSKTAFQVTDSKFTSNTANQYGGAIYLDDDECHIDNSIFTSNHAINGGAINLNYGKGYITNSQFESNTAEFGGAIISFDYLHVDNSKFKSNHAKYTGGAIYSDSTSSIANSQFESNSAIWAGAIYSSTSLSIESCGFTNNNAENQGGSIFAKNIANITDSSFKSIQNIEAIYFNCGNKTSGGLYLKNNKMVMSNRNAPAIWYETDIPYTSQLYLVFNNMSAVKGEIVGLCQLENGDGNTFRIADMNITLKNQSMTREFKLVYNNDLGGYLFNTSSLDYGTYQLSGSLYDYPVIDGTLNVVKRSLLHISTLTKVYGTSNRLTVTLTDENGNALSNTYIEVKLVGNTYMIKTDSNGQASLAINLVPNTYTAAVTFTGNGQYSSASGQVKILVKKATPKITAAKKTFKLKTKTKKYTIALKNNQGIAMKNTKVTINVNGKTYTAKTNSKGHATFKITKLNKKGKYTATIRYGGDKYYNSISKKATITVKG